MQSLDLVKTRTGDDGLASIATLRKLTHLNLDYTAVTGAGIALLQSLAVLQELRLDSAEAGDESIESLASLTNLKVLNLYHTLVSEAGFKTLRSKLPGCEIIWDRDSALPNRRSG